MFPLYDENRSITKPIITWLLITLNVIVFWWEWRQGFDITIFYYFGIIPALVVQGKRLLSIITSMFLHADFVHILSNMIYLFIFGDNVEDQIGHLKYLFFYLLFGVVGGLAHSIAALTFSDLGALTPTVGASGAISGILGAYVVFFPKAKIVSVVPSFLFVRLARVPALIFVGFWFILQLLYSGSMTNVAYIAHIGGFLTGMLIALIFRLIKRV